MTQIDYEAYTGSEPHAFVSFSREDKRLVQSELNRLHELGVRIYYPETDTHEETIKERIRGSAFFLVFVTDNVDESEEVLEEVGLALRESKEALCVHLVDMPMDGKAGLLLGRLPDVKMYRMREELYLRRLAKTLPDETLTRPIDLAGGDAPQELTTRPPPTFAERMKEYQRLIGIVALLLVLLLLIPIGQGILAIKERVTAESEEEAKTVETPEEKKARLAAEKIRAASLAKEAEHRAKLKKERDAQEVRRKAEQRLREAVRKAEGKARDKDHAGVIELLVDVEKEREQIDLEKRPVVERVLALAFKLRGLARSRLRDFEGAVRDLKASLALRTKDQDVRFEMADALRITKAYKDAIEAFSVLLKAKPELVGAWRKRAECHRRSEDFKAAEADYTQVIELRPRDATAYRHRAACRTKLGDAAGASDDLAKAREILKR